MVIFKEVSYVSYLCLQDSTQVLDLRPRCELMAQRSAVKGSVLVQNIYDLKLTPPRYSVILSLIFTSLSDDRFELMLSFPWKVRKKSERELIIELE